jgi:hypothetical protein
MQLGDFMRPSELLLGVKNPRLEAFGGKLSPGGAHISRTMMHDEATLLLSALPPTASAEDYRRAAIEENAIRKATKTTREKTYRHLRELYAFAETVPLFGLYRELVGNHPQDSPLLSLLVAWARDPLLRGTTAAILNARYDTEVTKHDLQSALEFCSPNQYSALNIDKVARNAGSSWTQSGHLAGRARKIRRRLEPRPVVLALALILASVEGLEGQALLSSIWCRLIDLSPTAAASLAAQAHREELIDLRAVGSVVEITFPRFRGYLEALL